ncbi:ninein-like protein isoform X2 [Bombina bombina]|uniref:ninein-like protein isoform X2 n=1 Tax=Bombina bombina TaxID=8345 RepID=UPI00235AB8FA|nr:ninein-like protein isoform X2 [Bombina bombina]
MDQEEENKYVSQLQEVFTSCDTTGTGYLDKEELTDLCHKLHLGEHLSLLLQTLLGNDHFARVNFDEFKEGFVAVLSSTIDISISEDESSYLEPVIPDEVKPKYVKGKKRYGRRTRPEREAAENEANKFLQEQHHVNSKRKSQLRRSSSLESVESLKSDEEAECAKETQNENFESQGQLRTWNTDIFDSPRRNSSPCSDMTEHQVRDIWEELGIDPNGYLNLQELAAVCKNIGLKDLTKEELQDLFTKLDRDGDGRVSFEEFQLGLFSHSPIASTPLKQRRPWTLYQLVEDTSHKTPSLLSNCGGFHLFSSIDDGTGFGNAEQILVIWEEEGLEDSKDILMSLDFSLDNQVNLVELTTALDNELIATKNKIHFAALASYKHELHYQHAQIEQVIRERDKVKQDLERAEKRNLQLADEVDDHTSVMETLNESKIRDLEQEYRQKLSVIRSELESEREQFIQQTDQHRNKLETDLANYQMEEAFLREKLNLSLKENSRLQKEMIELVGKLSESESQVLKLQNNVDHMMKDRRLADPHHVELFNQEEKFAEIIKEYEIQCRELRDRNDELQIQLETLRSQVSERKYSRLLAKMKDNKLLHHRAKEKIHHSHQHNDSPGKQSLSSKLRRSVSAVGVKGVGTCESDCSPMNMEVELTKHQVKEQQQEIQDLKIQLETKVNYYERELELMKTNFEKERKDTEQSFKIEISELEEQKADLEELNAKYQEVIDGLKEQLSKSAHYQEIEKKFEKEKVEMEQHYAKEIAELGQRMTHEKEQLEDELRRQNQHEVQAMRLEFSRLYEDNSILRSKAEHLQLEVYDLEDKNMMHRKQVEELKSTNDEIIGNLEELSKQTQDYQKELALLDAKRMELSATISHLTAQEEASQESLQHLNLKLREVSEKKEMVAAENEQLQEKLSALEEEKMQQSLDWEREKEQLAQELQMCKEKNDKYQEELSLLVTERMELSATISELRAGNHECLLQINSRVREVTQLKEEVTAEKKNLQEKLKALEEQNVHQNSAWEAEKEQLGHELLMYKEENQKYKEELNLLDTERQELGAIISDLKAHNEANQESIRHMTSRLEEVAEQKAKMAAEIRQLQEQIKALETEAFEQQSKWEKERELTEEGLQFCKVENQKYQDELDLLDTERAQLSATILDLREQCVQNQEEIQQVTRKLNDLTQQGEGATAEIVRLQETLAALEEEKIQQNSEWETNREQLEQGLQMSEKKIQDLILNHEKEMENLLSGLDESQQQIFIMEALQEEVSSLRQEKQSMEEKCQHITSQLKETKDQMTQMQQKEFNFKQTQAEYQSLQLNLSQVREKLEESQDQLQEANTKLALVESQHMREFQQLKEKASNSVPKEQLSQLQKRLQEEHQKVLQDKLRFHAEQTNRQLAMQQEEYEKVLRRMEERMEDVEMNLKNIRMMLQEKVNQLKEQLEKNAKSDLLLKDLYVENAQLMKALQVTEQRQKSAEKKNYLLEEKITALNKVIRNIAPASLVV